MVDMFTAMASCSASACWMSHMKQYNIEHWAFQHAQLCFQVTTASTMATGFNQWAIYFNRKSISPNSTHPHS